jgi:hypothetical protein
MLVATCSTGIREPSTLPITRHQLVPLLLKKQLPSLSLVVSSITNKNVLASRAMEQNLASEAQVSAQLVETLGLNEETQNSDEVAYDSAEPPSLQWVMNANLVHA